MKVIEGLRFGNECLNKMHQVGPPGEGPGEHGAAHTVPRAHACTPPSAKRRLCQMGGGEAATAGGVATVEQDRLGCGPENGVTGVCPEGTPVRVGEGHGAPAEGIPEEVAGEQRLRPREAVPQPPPLTPDGWMGMDGQRARLLLLPGVASAACACQSGEGAALNLALRRN